MHTRISRRQASAAIASTLAALAAPALAQAPTAIRIGFAISKTGPNAGGANVTTLPNYQLWQRDVAAAGGITLAGGRKLPVEFVEYDDRSNSEEAVRAIERLIDQDRVDFILPPWGTALNLAVGPALNRAGYPHLAVTAVTDRAPELARRWPNSFWLLGTSTEGGVAIAELLGKLASENHINRRVAMVSVADQFGIELATAGRAAFQRAGFTLVYDRSYPVGTQDLQPILAEAMRATPDAFVAFSYPPDTLALTEQARIAGFNPKGNCSTGVARPVGATGSESARFC
jgi:branched-chain amino acid transport system substrate-binding protein